MAFLPRSRRFLELVQLVLAFASVTAVADASRAAVQQDLRGAAAGYARDGGEQERAADRRFSDLVRFERKRREAEQRRSARALTLTVEAQRTAPTSSHSAPFGV